MAAPRITNPGQTIERCYERRQQALADAEHYDAKGFTYCAKLARRRAAALKATITRVSRQYLGVEATQEGTDR